MSDPAGFGRTVEAAVPADTVAADFDSTDPSGVDQPPKSGDATKSRGLYGDAWVALRRRPLFWVCAALILLYAVMAVFPQLFTSKDPNFANLSLSLDPPSSKAWFGYDQQGYDVYARTIYGARASLVVGVLSTIATLFLGVFFGVIGGYVGRWVDTVLSRMADVLFGIPFLLGAIVVLTTFGKVGQSQVVSVALVVATLAVLGFPVVMRLMRGSVISVKQSDYVVAARGLGASNLRIIWRHVLPNAIAPVLVYGSVSTGVYIGAEASLSYLGLGLQPPVISWGIAINQAQRFLRIDITLLLFPGLFLTVAVLAFVLLGEVIREAIDPKLR